MRVIIPVKPFAEAKQRLAPVLNPAERAALAEDMFRHVLRTASAVFGASDVLVISRAPDVLAIAESVRALALGEEGPPGLNSALMQAARFANLRGHSKVLVLASDLPLLAESDLAEMAGYACAIAPDRHDRGTNALIWPSHLAFAFGENSLLRHRTTAEVAGLDPKLFVRRGIAHDIDVPADLVNIYPNLARSSGSTRSA
ncbi:MAG TPA: 2-phospho-L-lactate guanylyltransferase [Rhizomicrobium sp.]|nr:2-phospho-L-lactate guanylyltransferase [Rhizomicrobium sp.]